MVSSLYPFFILLYRLQLTGSQAQDFFSRKHGKGGAPPKSGAPLPSAPHSGGQSRLTAHVLFAERRQRGAPKLCDGPHPFARIHVHLHQNKADRLIDITAGEDEQKRRLPHEARQADARQYKRVHERDLEDRPVRRIARRAVRVVLRPVAHADHSGDAVDHQEARADFKRFARKAHDGEQWLVRGYQRQTQHKDAAAAEQDEAFRPLIGRVELARADALAHKHRGGVRESREEADHKALQRAENRDRGDRLLRLAAEHDVDDHVAHADQNLIAENRKALHKIRLDKRAAPAEMLREVEQVGVPLRAAQNDDHKHVDGRPAHRGQRRAAHAERRHAQLTVDKHPVEAHIRRDGGDRRKQRDAHALGRAQQRAHRHRDDLQQVGKAHDLQVIDADRLNRRLVRIDLHDELRRKQREAGEDRGGGQHAHERQPVGPVDAVFIFRAPILREKQHAAAHKAPVSGEHQRRKLCA